MSREYIAVYIMANPMHTVLYVGVTSHLLRRIHEHRTHSAEGFSKRYNTIKLVYFEPCETMEQAIHREKRLKKYTRKSKLQLIDRFNPRWHDLWESITAS